jgi:hypothetical protein
MSAPISALVAGLVVLRVNGCCATAAFEILAEGIVVAGILCIVEHVEGVVGKSPSNPATGALPMSVGSEGRNHSLRTPGVASRLLPNSAGTLARWYTPAEALVIATSTNAELLPLSGKRNPYPGKLGVVEEGALADLLMVDGNRLENLELVADPKSFPIIVKDLAVLQRRPCCGTSPK